MHFVDTHQHLWDPARLPCAWCSEMPVLDRRFSIDDYVSAAAGTPITKTVFMEYDVDEPYQLAEAQLVQSIADTHPLIAGIVASGRPENSDFPAYLEQLSALPKLRGLRRVLHVVDDDVSQQPRFRENLRRLPAFGLTFDLCARAQQLKIAAELVDACPDVTFILDHCGVPDVKGRAFEPWRADLRAIAGRPNVHCKISGLVAYADPLTWTVADLRPWVEHVIACFGWDRVVWGGDWPVCTLGAPLTRWVDAIQELTVGASVDERVRLFHRNAERIYRV